MTSSDRPAPSPAVSAPADSIGDTSHLLTGLEDTRCGGPFLGSEREVLDAWLEEYRLSALLKIQDLDAEQLALCSVPPSSLSLLGVIRHLTEVEAYWLREVLHGEDVPDIHSSREHPDADLEGGSAATAAADVAAYREQIARCAAAAATWEDLDGPVVGTRHGAPLNLRWILTHLVEEYARHLGHMDLLREAIDGRTGY